MVIMMQRPSLQSTRDDGPSSTEHPPAQEDRPGRERRATGSTGEATDERRARADTSRHWLATAFVYLAAGAVGAVMGLVTVLNLHILAGLYEGYAATPAQVLEYSPVLAAVDVVILLGGPAFMVAATWWVRRRLATGPEPPAGR